MEQNKGIDKNQIAGILLIGAIMLGFGWWQTKNAPLVESATEATQDVEQVLEEELVSESQVADAVVPSEPDAFSPEEITISNAELSLTFSSAGATLTNAALADYHTYDDTAKTEALDLIKGNSQVFDIRLPGGEALSSKEFEVLSSSARSLVFSDGSTKASIELAEVGYDFTFIVSGTAESSGKPEIYWERSAQRTE